MKKYKIFSVILVVIILMTSFTGCGSKQPSKEELFKSLAKYKDSALKIDVEAEILLMDIEGDISIDKNGNIHTQGKIETETNDEGFENPFNEYAIKSNADAYILYSYNEYSKEWEYTECKFTEDETVSDRITMGNVVKIYSNLEKLQDYDFDILQEGYKYIFKTSISPSEFKEIFGNEFSIIPSPADSDEGITDEAARYLVMLAFDGTKKRLESIRIEIDEATLTEEMIEFSDLDEYEVSIKIDYKDKRFEIEEPNIA